jgi:hypothetical protein
MIMIDPHAVGVSAEPAQNTAGGPDGIGHSLNCYINSPNPTIAEIFAATLAFTCYHDSSVYRLILRLDMTDIADVDALLVYALSKLPQGT